MKMNEIVIWLAFINQRTTLMTVLYFGRNTKSVHNENCIFRGALDGWCLKNAKKKGGKKVVVLHCFGIGDSKQQLRLKEKAFVRRFSVKPLLHRRLPATTSEGFGALLTNETLLARTLPKMKLVSSVFDGEKNSEELTWKSIPLSLADWQDYYNNRAVVLCLSIGLI